VSIVVATKNRISEIRKSRGLTQRALAELAGTSQQQVQRIEAGVQGVRIELATKIAAALGLELPDIFPALVAPRQLKRFGQSRYVSNPARFEDGRIDSDPRAWTVKFFTHDGRVFLYGISSDEKSRLEKIVSHSADRAVVFAATTHWVAVNQSKIAATQFLFDLNAVDDEEHDDEIELRLHLIGAKEPVVFGIEPDTQTLEEADHGSSAQMQRMFLQLEMQDDDNVVFFDDQDGERVYLRSTEILIVEVPIGCCEPALWDARIEGDKEDQKLGTGPLSQKVASE
jgi:transcriptional regulator with XRE-family HTH domain